MPTSPPGAPPVPLPEVARARTLVAAPGGGVGNWTGAPSAVADGDGFLLAYRVRRPLTEGRGVAVVIARWDGHADGVDVVAEVGREAFGAESLERPALVRRPDGGWRLYVSCATPGSKHWWVDALDADTVEGLPDGVRSTVFPGDDTVAVKDPVVHVDATGWHAWVCCHPLDEAGAEDRMWTAYATSADGLAWSRAVPVLRAADVGWDRRGTRVASVVPGTRAVAWYDGRATADENWYERTGVAVAGVDGVFTPLPDGPAAQSPDGTHALRYLAAVPGRDGAWTLFFEASRPDGAHDLMVQSVPARPAAPTTS